MSESFSKNENRNGNFPRVSVVIPAYNVAEYIAETLDSVLAQTYKNYEVVVVNDGSPDTENLEKVLEKYLDKTAYLKQKNKGAATARNTGIENSRGELIAFLDGDDVWLPEFLESQTKFLDENKYGMVYADALLFGNHAGKFKSYMEQSVSIGEVTPETLIDGSCNVITSGTVVEKKHLLNAGLFNPTAFRMEDFELWFTMAKMGVKIGYQKKVLLKYRVRKTGLTGDEISSAERSVLALEKITERNILSESEEKTRLEKIRLCESEYQIAKGKYFLARENFGEASKHIAKAYAINPQTKLAIVGFLLRRAPRLTLRLFKKFRRAEFPAT